MGTEGRKVAGGGGISPKGESHRTKAPAWVSRLGSWRSSDLLLGLWVPDKAHVRTPPAPISRLFYGQPSQRAKSLNASGIPSDGRGINSECRYLYSISFRAFARLLNC